MSQQVIELKARLLDQIDKTEQAQQETGNLKAFIVDLAKAAGYQYESEISFSGLAERVRTLAALEIKE